MGRGSAAVVGWGITVMVALLVGQAAAQSPKVNLSLSVEQVQMIVQALPMIECRTVGQLATCRLAEETLLAIREQAKAQIK